MNKSLSQYTFVTFTFNKKIIEPIPASIRQESKKKCKLAFSSLCNSPNPRFINPKLGSLVKNPNFSDLTTKKEPKGFNRNNANFFKNSHKKILKNSSLQLVGKSFDNQSGSFFINPTAKNTENKPIKVAKKLKFPCLSEKKVFIRKIKQLNSPLLFKNNYKNRKLKKIDHFQDHFKVGSPTSLTGWDY